MFAKEWIMPGDAEELIANRRLLHRHPEIGFDLPFTTDLVKEKLREMGVLYTEKYGKGSVVAFLNPDSEGPCIALRADMDALSMQEKSGEPFSSLEDGKMHACGHDAHTAVLIAVARVLKRVEYMLPGKVMLVFQPAEEIGKGAKELYDHNILDGVDVIVGLHTDNQIDCGYVGARSGYALAAANHITLRFHGRSAHAAVPEKGSDALAMAVKVYNDIQLILTRQLDPLKNYVLSVTRLNAGTASNIVASEAEMTMSLRTFEPEVNDFIEERIRTIAAHAAEELGGTVDFTGGRMFPPLSNDPEVTRLVIAAAEKVVGPDRIAEVRLGMGSEDFSLLLDNCPGCYFRLGTRNPEKGCVARAHNGDFRIDEDALIIGCKTFVQFVFDFFRM